MIETSDVSITFAQPDAGWIDFTMRWGERLMEFPISHVYDPFYGEDFKIWLEQLVEQGFGALEVDTEGSVARIEVAPAEGDKFTVIGKPYLSDLPEFRATIDRRRFIAEFYGSLVLFWEGEELRKNWREWVFLDEYIDGQPAWDEDRPSKPWPIRSEKVERWLEGKS